MSGHKIDDAVEDAFDVGLRGDAAYQDASVAFYAVLQRIEDRQLLLDLELAANRMAGAAMVVGFMVAVQVGEGSSVPAGSE